MLKISNVRLFILLFAVLTPSKSFSFKRHLLDVRSSAPCPLEWDISPCECSGRPSAASISCNSIKDADRLDRIFKANNDKSSFRDIEIHGSGLTSLPAKVFFPHSFFLFLISNNSIQSIDKEAFKGSEETANVIRLDGNNLISFPFEALTGMKYLAVLELNRNQLTIIQDNAFPPLESLANLDLGSNKLSTIGKNAFSRLPALGRLELSNNQLTVLGERSLATDKVKEPVVVLLSNNKIEKIDDTAFTGLKAKVLNLANNNLTILKENAFHQLLKDGTELNLEGNSFDCDLAEMSWLRKLTATMKQKINGFKCKSGKTLDELN